jgi:hypothetical protein
MLAFMSENGPMTSNLAAEGRDVSVRVALKADDPIDRIRALKAADEQVELWVVQAVGEARQAGRSWSDIGQALGVSRQAAWQLYNAALSSAIAEVRQKSDLSEEEAMAMAGQELRAVRVRRRR